MEIAVRDTFRDHLPGGTTSLWALLAILALGAALTAAPTTGATADATPASTQAAAADPTAGPQIEVTPLDEADDDVGIASAQRCSGDVCIRVDGTGLTVDSWETWFNADYATCTRAYFWQDDDVIATSDWACSDGPARFTSTWNNPGTFPDGTQLCNTWANATGKPCVTIKK